MAPYNPKSATELQQWTRLLEFKDRFPSEELWWKYKGPSDFERQLRHHLHLFLNQRFRADSPRAHPVVRPRVALPSQPELRVFPNVESADDYLLSMARDSQIDSIETMSLTMAERKRTFAALMDHGVRLRVLVRQDLPPITGATDTETLIENLNVLVSHSSADRLLTIYTYRGIPTLCGTIAYRSRGRAEAILLNWYRYSYIPDSSRVEAKDGPFPALAFGASSAGFDVMLNHLTKEYQQHLRHAIQIFPPSSKLTEWVKSSLKTVG